MNHVTIIPSCTAAQWEKIIRDASHTSTPLFKKPKQIDLFTNVNQIYGFPPPPPLGPIVTSHFINLYLKMVFQYLESTLHTLVVATSDKPRTSFQVVRNNICKNGMHTIISEQVDSTVLWTVEHPIPLWRKTDTEEMRSSSVHPTPPHRGAHRHRNAQYIKLMKSI